MVKWIVGVGCASSTACGLRVFCAPMLLPLLVGAAMSAHAMPALMVVDEMLGDAQPTDLLYLDKGTRIDEIEQKLARLQAQSYGEQAPFSVFSGLDGQTLHEQQVARLDGQAALLGLDTTLAAPVILPDALATTPVTTTIPDILPVSPIETLKAEATTDQDSPTNIATLDDKTILVNNQGIDPERYLPSYTGAETGEERPTFGNDTIEKAPNVLQRAYSRLFNDGVPLPARLTPRIYLIPQTQNSQAGSLEALGVQDNTNTSAKDEEVLVSLMQGLRWQTPIVFGQEPPQPVDMSQEPYKNIKLALSEITLDAVPSFSSALPRLTETVSDALQAVGYYQTKFHLINAGEGKIDVIIESLGEPVRLDVPIFEVRTPSDDKAIFGVLTDEVRAEEGKVLNHGRYRAIKDEVDARALEAGYFEGKWLSDSVDVLLPDNTAELSLVYDTGERYAFDEVVFFTFDGETGELTDDPAKLPVDLSLLQKLVAFDTNDPFERKKTAQLSADLMATRFFNSSNVEVVLPARQAIGDEVSVASPNTPVLDENGQTIASIGALDFSASEDLLEKLSLVSAKANRLYNSPSDRVLGDNKKQSRSLLGRVSDAISQIAEAILPDESGDNPSLPEGAQIPVLAGRKTPEQVLADKKVPLYVFVMADKPKDAEIGLGWGSDTGVRLTTRFDNNLINKKGYQAGVQLSVSELDRMVNLYASRPLTHPLNDKLTGNLKYYEEDIRQSNDAKLSARTLESTFARTKIKANGWNKSYFMRYRLDELDTNAPAHTWQDLPVQFNAGRPVQSAVLAGVSLHKTQADNLVSPTKGYRQHYSLEVGSDALFSDTNMLIAKAGLGGMMSFGDNAYGKKRAHQLIGRLDLGYLWADDFRRVPYKLRFFAGGDQSIRGYNYQSLSPVNQGGFLTGGQALAVGSLEYNYEVKDGLRVAMFGDVGGAYDEHFNPTTKIGAGVGLRFASPVGTVRIDIAKGIEKEHTPVRLHFLIGLPF